MKKVLIILLACSFFASCSKKPGTVKGNVSYLYNDYVGNKADVGANVFLVSSTKNGPEGFTRNSLFFLNPCKKVNADSRGDYVFENVPPGKYYLVIVSNKVTKDPKKDNFFPDEVKKVMVEDPSILDYEKVDASELTLDEAEVEVYNIDFGITFI